MNDSDVVLQVERALAARLADEGDGLTAAAVVVKGALSELRRLLDDFPDLALAETAVVLEETERLAAFVADRLLAEPASELRPPGSSQWRRSLQRVVAGFGGNENKG